MFIRFSLFLVIVICYGEYDLAQYSVVFPVFVKWWGKNLKINNYTALIAYNFITPHYTVIIIITNKVWHT